MSSNLGYMDRLGEAAAADLTAARVEDYNPVKVELNRALSALQLDAKIQHFNRAQELWEAAEGKWGNKPDVINSFHIKNLRRGIEIKVTQVANTIRDMERRNVTENEPFTWTPEQNGGNGAPTGSMQERKFPWLPIGIAAAAIGAAFFLPG